ncbi:hypothetical protein ACFPM7_17690 [Actinokineospora guangxiensis]|uniref:Excalibur calcium-binding domain-containing protein n=1 Tax=Actinokineospora guangxiensis TaxID=1490288 RepID=A0ABW0ERA3_9PSEU
MLENSTAGLYMLDPARDVTVTREEDHQHVLARYPVTQRTPRRVAVELTWCTVASGKHKGTRAIEVRLDGHRTGELTRAMSDRYTPFVEAVTTAGLRPGCEATISSGDRGLQIQLHLPPGDAPLPNPRPLRPTPAQSASAWTSPPPRPTPSPAGTARFPTPAPYAAPTPGYRPHIPGYPVTAPTTLPTAPAPRKKSKKVPVAFAGTVIGMVGLITGITTSGDDTPEMNPVALATSTTAAPTTTLPPRPTTTPPRPTTPKPTPRPTTTTEPKPTTTPPPPPPPPPKPRPTPEQDCNPNYTPCVPNDPVDVDCAGGSGNGPSYVEGPVEVIGQDVYDLDRDNDGEGCE